jgi:hypothetical protein
MTETALKNLLEPGTHRCTWTLSKPPDTPNWQVAGDVELIAQRQPRGGVYGKAPTNWTVQPGGVGAGFPQHFEYPIVYGELDGGLDVVLLDARLSVFGEEPRQGLFSFKGANAGFDAWAALVGRGAPRSDTVLVDSGVIQVTNLDSFAARSPLVGTTFPADNIYQHQEPTWTAKFDKASLQEWEDSDAKVSMSYHGSAEVLGQYRFGLRFSPIITIELQQAIPLTEFMIRWVWPVQGLISAATGRTEKITHLSCSPVIEGDDRPASQRRFQVFQASVSHAPYLSTNDVRDKHVSAIRLSEGESLLSLLRGWQELQDEQNPILETYDASALGPDQTPRARFLLLIQALEGLYGHEDRLAPQRPRFEAKRNDILAKCEAALNAGERRFLNRFLLRSPQNLEMVLRQMVESPPVDLEPELADCALVKTVITDADTPADTPFPALSYVRNGLSHGTRTFDRYHLHAAAGILERVVRGHLLRLLAASETAQSRVLEPSDY